MKNFSSVGFFLLGAMVTFLLTALVQGRSCKNVNIPLIDRETALSVGAYRYQDDYTQVSPFNIGEILAKCSCDLSSFDGGTWELAGIFKAKKDGRYLFFFEQTFDAKNRGVIDRVMVYIYNDGDDMPSGKFFSNI